MSGVVSALPPASMRKYAVLMTPGALRNLVERHGRRAARYGRALVGVGVVGLERDEARAGRPCEGCSVLQQVRLDDGPGVPGARRDEIRRQRDGLVDVKRQLMRRHLTLPS
ncbi:MAG: hypothetical protein ACLTKG_01825 [Collinsella intestinalis]